MRWTLATRTIGRANVDSWAAYGYTHLVENHDALAPHSRPRRKAQRMSGFRPQRQCVCGCHEGLAFALWGMLAGRATGQRNSINVILQDTKTIGTDTTFDDIPKFAVIQTDGDLNELNHFQIRCRI